MLNLSFDWAQVLNIFFKTATYIGACFAAYVFIQRVHNQTQQRSLKAICDEIIKVNDFTIEFIAKYNIAINASELDDKTITELIILKAKINAHLNYITDYLTAFPYGGPLNYIFFMIQERYFSEIAKAHAEDIEMKYQDSITKDSILSIEIDFLESKKIKTFDDNTRVFVQQDIDKIINLGSQLQTHLEDNTRKFL